jgi:hypothetical protein
MSAPVPVAAPMTWPTVAEVEEVAEKLRVAYNAVDEFQIRTHRLVDHQEPWERQEGVPVPSLEDVGVLVRIVTELDHRIEGLKRWRKEFQQMRDSASAYELEGAS